MTWSKCFISPFVLIFHSGNRFNKVKGDDKRKFENSHEIKNSTDYSKRDDDYQDYSASCSNDNVDIAFLVDCTRSMRRHVLHTKKNIGSVVKHIRKRFNNHVRLAFVAYRDLTCPNNIQEMDFTKDISEFTNFADKNC